MDARIRGMIHIVCEPAVKVFDNGSAVLVRPEVADWIRTSEVGVWIFERLRAAPRTAEGVIAEVATHYGLPLEAVRDPTLRFLKALVDQGYARAEAVPTELGSASVAAAAANDLAEAEQRPGVTPARLEDLGLRQLWLHITSRCNLRCEYCYYRVEHPGRELTLNLAQRLFDEAATLGVSQIVLSGGEPMLHSQILDLVQACRKTSRWYIKVVSNGTMPEGDSFDRVVELIDDLRISIDGIDEATHDAVRGKGSFARAVRAFKQLYQTRVSVSRGIAFTPMPENVDQIPELNKLGYQLAADYLHLNHPKPPADPAQRAALEARGFLSSNLLHQAIANFRRLYLNILSDRKEASGLHYRPLYLDASFNCVTTLFHLVCYDNCGAGITMLGFDPDGTAYPCAALTGRPECQLGTYPEQSLDELRQAGRVWNRAIFSVDRDPICARCIYRYFCGGGCRATSERLSDRDVFCPVLSECYDDFFKYASLPHEQLVRAARERPTVTWDHAKTDGCAKT